MAEGEQDEESKTEQPTQKRLEEAVKKGNVAISREVGSFLMLFALALTVTAFAPSIMHGTKMVLTPFLSDFATMPGDGKGLGLLLRHTVFASAAVIAAPLLASIVAAILGGVLQNGLVFSGETLVPKFSKISPMAGIKRLFSMRSVVEFIKNLTKITIVGVVAFLAVYPELGHIKQLPDSTAEGMLAFLAMLTKRMIIGILVAMFFIALLDLMYQRFQYTKSLRMTKQEIKDEYKQAEGDPVIKQRLRRLRMERARKRMMSAIPEADVVITNPTHFAVALKYETGIMQAPMVVAMGQDLIALKIREVAEEHGVPIVENPPLARALFASCQIDKEIPFTHYEAVAKVISYVYNLKGKKFAG